MMKKPRLRAARAALTAAALGLLALASARADTVAELCPPALGQPAAAPDAGAAGRLLALQERADPASLTLACQLWASARASCNRVVNLSGRMVG